jgi:F-type H+-transporting ATPase subunit delta
MHETRSAVRYARSIFQLALERGELEIVFADMNLVNNVIAANDDLANMLRSPIIKADQKINMLDAIFGGKIGKLTAEFIRLIVKKRREMHIAQIAKRFVQLYLENNGIEEATLITAFPVDESFRKSIISLVEKHSKLKVELHEIFDSSVIGGFVLRFGNKQIDASVERELELLRREFEKTFTSKTIDHPHQTELQCLKSNRQKFLRYLNNNYPALQPKPSLKKWEPCSRLETVLPEFTD